MALRRMYVACSLPASVMDLVTAEYDVTFGTASSLVEGAAGHDVIMVNMAVKADHALIERLPDSIKAIATYSVGLDHLDLDAARARGIAVFNTPDVLTDACAETAMFLLLGACRRASEAIALIRSKDWRGTASNQFLGLSITGKRLAILGMGRIGQAIAERARGFGMAVDYHNRSRLPEALEHGATYHPTAESLLASARFLVLACPATPQTIGLIDARRIALMPQGAVVVNIGRGSVVNDADLIAALASGRLYAAGLDVFNGEPNIHPGYFDLPNVFMLPHIASATVEARDAMGQILLDGLRALWAGNSAANRLV
ncbi:MAG TPA: D-glycerate dehydrogenase [Patescibacteria group bacterium]|nr:D-glycerate dehydrogenase [Patescibacteria group bacterium]